MLKRPVLNGKTRRRKELIISLGLICLIPMLFQSCQPKAETPVIIALSKGHPDSSYANYYNWIRSIDSTVICRDMYAMPLDSALLLFRNCSGLLLTGGTDIDPSFYGKAFDTARCLTVDKHRDLLEMALIDSALAWGMPVLGICRGLQVLNVTLGGSLIVDIPADYGTTVIHQCEDYLKCFHPVAIEKGSLLHEITGTLTGEVTTNHHQAANEISSQLKAAAFSADGIVEAFEWENPKDKSFLLGVQWHPERMGRGNPLSGSIGRRFVEECRRMKSR